MNRCVLIVDKDSVALDAIQQYIEDAGYTVVTAEGEAEAIQQYDAAIPAIVIFAVVADTNEFRELFFHITEETDWALRPATIITGKREEMGNWFRANTSRTRSIDVHISKPYNPLEMVSFVKRIFAHFQDGRFIPVAEAHK